MSLIAAIATSVSAYAVRRSNLVPGDWSRTWASISIPVISGIRWSEATSATDRSRRVSSASSESASAPEVAGMTR